MIVISEPQCCGFEHVPFNAAFLGAVLLAYPEAAVVFMAEHEHLNGVRHMLGRYCGTALQRVEWQVIDIPPRNMGGWRRLFQERTEIGGLLQCAKDRQARLLILTSITSTGLLALKLHLYRAQYPFPMVAVIHSVLGTVMRLPRKPWKWLLNLRYVLRLPQTPALRYIALGDSIFGALEVAYPALARHFSVLDHPYFMDGETSAEDAISVPLDKIRFGYMGVGHRGKGFSTFAHLAKEVREQTERAEFLLVGFLSSTADCADYPAVAGCSKEPLSAAEYKERAISLAYVVSVAKPENYRLVASASFLDALLYTKPGIYLRNPYVEHYFQQMGDIGYLCDTYDEVRETVLGLAKQFPTERYRKQCATIRQGRRLFTPDCVAMQLRKTLVPVSSPQ